MVPAPPLRILASRNDSLPTNTSKVRAARAVRTTNASRKVLVLFQSPELSFIPVIEQQPVPGIMRDGSIPAATRASSNAIRSSADIEFASLLVPNTASPQLWESNHWQCLMNRCRSGERSALNGVTTGAKTPRMGSGIWFLTNISAQIAIRDPTDTGAKYAVRKMGLEWS